MAQPILSLDEISTSSNERHKMWMVTQASQWLSMRPWRNKFTSLCSKLLVYKMNQIRSLPVPASVNVALQRVTLGQFCHHKINKRTTLWTDYSQVRQFCKPTSLSQAICLSVCVSRARKNDVSHVHLTQGTWTSRAGFIPTWSLSCLDVHFQCSSRLLRRTTVLLFYFCSGVLFASNPINWDAHWSRQDPPKRSFYL